MGQSIVEKKKCTKCKLEKSLDNFNKSTKAKDGLQHYCKECLKEYRITHNKEIREYLANYRKTHKEKLFLLHVIWYAKNQEIIRAKERQRYFNNRERIRTQVAKHYQENKEELKYRSRKYYAEHKEEIKEKRRKNRNNIKVYNKEYHRKYYLSGAGREKVLLNVAKRRASKFKAEGNYTRQDVFNIGERQNWECYWQGPDCEKDCSKVYHIDHLIPLSREGTNWPSNLVLSCPTCNLQKNNKTPEEYLRFITRNSKNE